MHKESWVRQGEYFHRLRLFDNIIIPDKGDEYIFKYNTESSDNVIELNPYVSLVNGTDFLIVKEIPDLFVMTCTLHLDNSKLSKINMEIFPEVSSDGINYKERTLHPLVPDLLRQPTPKKKIQYQNFKEVLVFLIRMDFSYKNDFAVGTYLRCKIKNIGEVPLIMVPFNSMKEEKEEYSAELSLHIMGDD